MAQCYYLDFDDRNRQKPIYVYLNSTGCMNEKVWWAATRGFAACAVCGSAIGARRSDAFTSL